MNEKQIAFTTTNPTDNFRLATDVASLCKKIVTETAVAIQGRKYVRVEGWESIAVAHGCIPGIQLVERIDGGTRFGGGGFRAVAELRKPDGTLLATAEGFVGEDEPTWFGGERNGKILPKRPDYAIRAMAQTRAISRVCRSVFAHVVVLMDAGLETTPADEVPDGGFNDDMIQRRQHEREVKAEEVRRLSDSMPFEAYGGDEPPTEFQKAKAIMDAPEWRGVSIHFGKNKGVALGDLSPQQLHWYANDWLDAKINGSSDRAPTTEDTALVNALLQYRREHSAEKARSGG